LLSCVALGCFFGSVDFLGLRFVLAQLQQEQLMPVQWLALIV